MLKNLISSTLFCIVIGAICWIKWKTIIFTSVSYSLLLVLIILSYIAGSIVDHQHLIKMETDFRYWIKNQINKYEKQKEMKIIASKNINPTMIPPI